MSARRLRGLIFDIDGTLADTEEVHRYAFNRALAEFGVPAQWDRAEHRRRMTIGAGRERLTAMFAEPAWRAVYPDRPAERMAAEVHARKTQIFAEAIEAGQAKLRPGVKRLLTEAVQAGLTLAVASTAHRTAVHTVLRVGLGEALYRRFAAVISGNDVVDKKPHPEAFRSCLTESGLTPAEAIAFEDSRTGLESATAAGITTVITYNRWTDDQDFSGAALVADCLGEPEGPACAIRSARVDLGRPGWIALEHLERLAGA